MVTSQSAEALPEGVKKISMDEAFATSAVVSLHCPLKPDNKAFVNAELLSKARKGLVLINTARGGLIDEKAVAEALHNGHLAAYA